MSVMSSRAAAALLSTASILAAGGLLFACDEVYADPVTIPPGPTTFDAGGGATAPRAPPIACNSAPRENGPCPRTGAVCEVGESADPTCNGLFVCVGDSVGRGLSWTEQSRGVCPTCPADPATIVDGAPCDLGDAGAGDEAELQCNTATGVCACTTGPDGAHAHPRRWVCVTAAEDCPKSRPLLGQPCVGDRSCDYGACAFKRGTRMICESEVWQVEGASCN